MQTESLQHFQLSLSSIIIIEQMKENMYLTTKINIIPSYIQMEIVHNLVQKTLHISLSNFK